jgi:ABC-2 type transport system permease protein
VIAVMRSEWIKLRTVRATTVLFIVAVALPVVICGLTAALSNLDESPLTNEDVVGVVTLTSTLTALLLGVIGAMSLTAEFGFNTIRPTFAATPRRWKVLAAKAILVAACAAVTGALVMALCQAVMRGIISSRGFTVVEEAGFNQWPPIFGVVVFAVIVCLFGMAIGTTDPQHPARGVHHDPVAFARGAIGGWGAFGCRCR